MISIIVFFLVTILLMALSLKWELNRKTAFPWAVLMGLSSSITIVLIRSAGLNLNPFQQLFIAGLQASIFTLIAILVLFFRNPERIPPAQEGILVSPADGIVKYVKEIQNREFPFTLKNKKTIPLSEFAGSDILANGGIQIGIGMTLLDVHVNRSPIAGNISHLIRIPGSFDSLKKIGSVLENERVVATIEGDAMKIGVVLIASRLVRRICTYVSEGQNVRIGQKIGMIRFGSQLDVLIPKNNTLKIHIKPGDKVKAGVSILATF
jgi:phosphatidylserine decarboxylase